MLIVLPFFLWVVAARNGWQLLLLLMKLSSCKDMNFIIVNQFPTCVRFSFFIRRISTVIAKTVVSCRL